MRILSKIIIFIALLILGNAMFTANVAAYLTGSNVAVFIACVVNALTIMWVGRDSL